MPLDSRNVSEKILEGSLGRLGGCLVEGNSEQRRRERRLRRRGCFRLIQRTLLHGSPFLLLIGLDLLARDLARAQLDQDILDRMIAGRSPRRSDQDFLEIQRIALVEDSYRLRLLNASKKQPLISLVRHGKEGHISGVHDRP